MNTLLWLIDKFADAIAPHLFAWLRERVKKKPIKTSFVFLMSITSVASIWNIRGWVPFFPIPILPDDKPLRLVNVSRAENEFIQISENLIAQAGISFEADELARDDSDFDAWAYANIMVGLGPNLVSAKLHYNHQHYFNKWMKQNGSCWAQLGKKSDPCHTGATSWVLIAMTTNSIKPTLKMWSYLLEQQDNMGWWSLYQNSQNEKENANTYATAIALLAIDSGLRRNMIQNELLDRANLSVLRAKTWLMSNKINGCAWKAYPYRNNNTDPPIAISSLVMYTLQAIDSDALNQYKGICVNNLIAERPLISDMYQSGEWIPLNNGSLTKPDSVRHQKLIWTVMALSKFYPSLSYSKKAIVREYVDMSLFSDVQPSENKLTYSWQKAEFALMLRTILNKDSDDL